ncbi:MAPEG family protein [Chitinolyticbacter albus]|uniref:MAPEG family protein n=1 Tax=Chitinolyticbacter albus TaxID=2961951 RepID=UPI00210D3813|nr:MAPEG family protein [Chitinolyticbacter albus]
MPLTVAEYCILIACLLPIACAWIAKSRGFDNHNPRQSEAGLSGLLGRAHAAQLNGYESLPIFIAGVLVAERAHHAQPVIDGLAMAFIAARVGYIGAYLADLASLRSIVWLAGIGCCIAMFLVG